MRSLLAQIKDVPKTHDREEGNSYMAVEIANNIIYLQIKGCSLSCYPDYQTTRLWMNTYTNRKWKTARVPGGH